MGCAPSPETSGYVHPDADRLAAFNRVYEKYLVVEDLYPSLARRFVAEGATRVAEIGGGRGPIARELSAAGVDALVVDLDEAMLADAPRPAGRGDLRCLPLGDASVDGVAAVNSFYFLEDPLDGLCEAHRILEPGGIFMASSPSRWNDPELEGIDPRWGEATTFDAEDAPRLVAEVFSEFSVEPWTVVAYVLPDSDAIADYLHAFNVPDWQAQAARIKPPLHITKKGAEVWARR